MNAKEGADRAEMQVSPLLSRLDSALAYRLTLLLAPAGYGKSALLRRWADGLSCPIAWLTLSPDDNEPARFLSDLATALRSIQPEVEEICPKPSAEEQQATVEDQLIALINLLATAPEDFLLILDNYHLIAAPTVHRLVELLLEHPPPQMHVVIATREEPPLPLPRLRVRRQLLMLAPGTALADQSCEPGTRT